MYDLKVFTRQEKLAYAAGIIDGEGCLRAFRAKRGCFMAVLTVSMTNPYPLFYLEQLFGGTVRQVKRRSKRRTMWTWNLGQGDALRLCLEAIVPCLIVKEVEAYLLLFLLDSMRVNRHPGRIPLPSKTREIRELIVQACKEEKRIEYAPVT